MASTLTTPKPPTSIFPHILSSLHCRPHLSDHHHSRPLSTSPTTLIVPLPSSTAAAYHNHHKPQNRHHQTPLTTINLLRSPLLLLPTAQSGSVTGSRSRFSDYIQRFIKRFITGMAFQSWFFRFSAGSIRFIIGSNLVQCALNGSA